MVLAPLAAPATLLTLQLQRRSRWGDWSAPAAWSGPSAAELLELRNRVGRTAEQKDLCLQTLSSLDECSTRQLVSNECSYDRPSLYAVSE
eukprot:Skav231640  [mRNA]  locus=scaffold1144:3436:4074:- [translate_table: standard]